MSAGQADQSAGTSNGATAGFRFPPHDNGLDYLHSVVEHLDGQPTSTDLKYAVLHLQAATEVLLKVRLIREHWALVFKDPDKATLSSYKSGDFVSIGMKETLARLKNIAGVELSQKTTASFDRLSKERNKLQHFGLEQQAAEAIEKTVGEVLDVLLVFITNHLKPGADEGEGKVYERTLETIRDEIDRIGSLVDARKKRITPEIDARAKDVVQCPGCSEFAFLLEADDLRCLFCDRRWQPDQAAEEYGAEVLGVTWRDISKGADEPVVCCPECDMNALVWGVTTADGSGHEYWVCFNCCVRYEYQDIDSCGRCGAPMFSSDESFACSDCW